jgi:hypothetical protein
MLGGWISNAATVRRHRAQAAAAVVGLAALAVTAFFGRFFLNGIEVAFTSISLGLLVSCLGLFFLPVTALSTFGPQCVQHLAARGMPPGAASGIVYGISTLGNITGVMLTAFVLIPNFRVSMLMYGWLAAAVFSLFFLIRILRANPAGGCSP